jgi:16S rRNA (cytosine967-C5)-methyltransferase
MADMAVRAMDARAVATRVVERLLADDAYVAAALDAELRRSELSGRDRALATEIAYGVARTRGVLKERISTLVPKPIKAGDTFLWAHLFVASYQLLLLERVPPHAVVDSVVTAVRKKRGDRVAGFVNALCRRLASGPRLDREQTVLGSIEPWLHRALVDAVGPDEARALVGVGEGSDASFATIRLVGEDPPPAWLADALPGHIAERARRVDRQGDLRRREGYAEGRFTVQEEGAQVVALALGARPGERVLDVCAGRGQKATYLAEVVGPRGQVVASDLHGAKLRVLASELARLGLPPVKTHAVDLTCGTGDLPKGFDRVLVDAPCTGTGTLRRRPEIASRLMPDDPERLAAVQASILRHAAECVRPGGRVVYAVCSVLASECEGVVARVLDVLEEAPFDAPEASALFGHGRTSGRLLPRAHGTDGYFIASFRRR